jgi:hypothetical protein
MDFGGGRAGRVHVECEIIGWDEFLIAIRSEILYNYRYGIEF